MSINGLLFIAFFFVFIPTVFPFVHELLRDNVVFGIAMFFAVAIAIAAFFLYSVGLDRTNKINDLILLSPLTFLSLYKLFDLIIFRLKKPALTLFLFSRQASEKY